MAANSLIYRLLTIPQHHRAASFFNEARIMTYLLPRGFIIVIAWGITCALIKNLWPDADPTVFGVVGVLWATGGMAYFVYLRKLRRDIEELERNRGYSVSHTAV